MSLHPTVPDWPGPADADEELWPGVVRAVRSAGDTETLLVDDDPDVLDTAASFLERQRESLTVVRETDAERALDRLSDAPGRFDCVVSDYEMPGMDGLALLTAVREDHPDLPFILYTGRGSEAVASEAISAGVTDYLQKETGTEQYELLANRVENAVTRHRMTRTVEAMRTRLVQLADSTGEILWTFSSDWDELAFVNSAYEDVWGRPVRTLAENPRSFLDGVHPDDRADVERAMERLSNGETVDVEYRVVRPDGDVRWVRSHGEPVRDEDDDVVSVSGITQDVTEYV